jgi:hypothetical protein
MNILNVCPQILIGLLIALLALPVSAADIKTVGLPGNQRLRISGPIEAGDQQAFLELLRANPTFPAGVLIDSGDGDLEAGMAIGQIIRDAILPVSASGQCGSGCILIWIGGTQRATRTAFDPRALTLHADAIHDYLLRMELNDETIDQLLNTSDLLATERVVELLGTISTEHEARLAERCGALDEQQQQDRTAIQALAAVDSSLNAMTTGMGGQAMYVVDPETERLAATARELPADYRRSIEERHQQIGACRRAAVTAWRQAEAE